MLHTLITHSLCAAKVKMMKTLTLSFKAEQSKQVSPSEGKQSRTSWVHYILAGVLLVVAYLISSLSGISPDTTSSTAISGFVLYWLGGGLITLLLLTVAAKR
jgi:hypothetical protein